MKKSLTATLIASAITAFAPTTHAAGLGGINVMSGLGQPLRAEIELQATPQELDTLSARVPSPDVFQQSSVSYSPLMTAIRIEVEPRGNRPVLRVSSDRPINEPFLDLLVELNWASGRLLREYTFLLDPVDRPQAAAVPMQGVVQPPRAAAPSAEPAAARSAPAVSPPRADNYTVRRGDTLQAIAERFRPQGVSLDQMLVSLLRNNPGAFDGGNMNRLRAGAILNIPDAGQANSIDGRAARREIVAQAADFNAYRQRLAGVAQPRAETDDTASREQSGSITPRVESPEAAESADDQVRVSGAGGQGQDPDGSGRIEALQEELAARDRELAETNSRLAELEQTIRDMQRLIAMSNQNLAMLQQQMAAQGGEVPELVQSEQFEADPTEAGQSETGRSDSPAEEPDAPVGEGADALPADAQEAQPQPQTQTEEPPPAQAEPQPPVAQPSLIESLLADRSLLMGGAGILILLLAYAAYRVRARRKAEEEAGLFVTDEYESAPEARSVIGVSGGESVDTGDTSMLESEFSQSGLSAIDTDEGVDPVAEADVYMAYGRDAQAEEILLDALKADPGRSAIYLKLLELYAQRGDARQFEAVATDFYSRTSGEGEDWARAAAMGRQIDPDNPLYGDGRAVSDEDTPTRMGGDGRDATAAAAAAGAAVVGMGATQTEADQEEPQDAGIGEGDDTTFADLEFNLDAAADQPQPEVESATADDSAAEEERQSDEEEVGMSFAPLDFDLDDSGERTGSDNDNDRDVSDLAPAQTGDDAEVGAETPAEPDLSFDLDLDLDQPAGSTPAGVADETDELQRMADALEAEQGSDHEATSIGSGRDEHGFDETIIAPPEMLAGDDEHSMMDLEQTEFDERLLDFDLDLAGPEESASEAEAAPAFDLSEINLDLEEPAEGDAVTVDEPRVSEPEAAAAPTDAAEGAASDDELQEVETKLELARAYEEMGDLEGARELVEEVMSEGSAPQRDAAQALLERLQ